MSIQTFNTRCASPHFTVDFYLVPQVTVLSRFGRVSYHLKTEEAPAGLLSKFEMYEGMFQFKNEEFIRGAEKELGCWSFDICDFDIQEYEAPPIASCIPF